MQPQSTIPHGFCQCGCGQRTKPYTKTNTRYGAVRGELARYAWHHTPGPKRALADRLWGKVNKTENCWLWTGHLNKQGYGRIWSGNRMLMVHRAAYELTYGDIPDGLYALHHCDAPACIRPDHLFLGTIADNNADMMAKGRGRHGDFASWCRDHPGYMPRGVANPAAKLDETAVRVIRDRYASGQYAQRKLAAEFGVTHTLIRYIVQRKVWKHIP